MKIRIILITEVHKKKHNFTGDTILLSNRKFYDCKCKYIEKHNGENICNINYKTQFRYVLLKNTET